MPKIKEDKLIDDDFLARIKEKIGIVPASKEVAPLEVISSGSLILDNVLGVGGFPLGSIVEIWGEKGSSKSTIAINTAREAQRNGYDVVYLDIECQSDNKYTQDIGVDFKKFELFNTNKDGTFYGEQVLQFVEMALTDSKYKLIILDSLPALMPRKWLEDGAMNYDTGGRLAAIAGLITRPLARFGQLVKAENKLLLIINQVRANWGGGLYSPQYSRPCGEALEHWVRILLQLSPSEAIKKGDEQIGLWITVKVNKSKVAIPKKDRIPLIWGMGIDTVQEVIDLGVKMNIFDEKDNKLVYKEYILGKKTKDLISIREFFNENPTVLNNLISEIRHAK